MRPINRGLSPIEGDFDNYRDAFPELMARLGPYCSYCERRMPTNLAVEHIQPKDGARYPELIGRWDNYVLGCVNCNGTKGDKDVLLEILSSPIAITRSSSSSISLTERYRRAKDCRLKMTRGRAPRLHCRGSINPSTRCMTKMAGWWQSTGWDSVWKYGSLRRRAEQTLD